jgi:hypothetical protein
MANKTTRDLGATHAIEDMQKIANVMMVPTSLTKGRG